MSKREKLAEIERAVAEYRVIEAMKVKTLRKLSKKAEESGDYYDYDQACYSTWEYLTEEGSVLAARIERAMGKA